MTVAFKVKARLSPRGSKCTLLLLTFQIKHHEKSLKFFFFLMELIASL